VDNSEKGPPILITKTKDAYCELYIRHLDLLLAANGGEVSYKMDIHAATVAYIPVIPVDVLGMFGATVPAFVYGDNGEKK
jgi:hypothetical protein